jgi:hypothetical protein
MKQEAMNQQYGEVDNADAAFFATRLDRSTGGTSPSCMQEPSKPIPVCNYFDRFGRRIEIRDNKEKPEPTSPLAIMIGHPATLFPLCLCSPTSRSVINLIGMRTPELHSI